MTSGQDEKARFIDGLGAVVGEEYYRLYSYWIEARVQLKEYNELYGDKVTVEMLNTIGAGFFGRIQLILLDNLILHITRLTDSSKSGKFRNLSIETLQERIENYKDLKRPGRFRDSESRAELTQLVKDAQDLADFARQHRDKRIAHLDHDTIMGSTPAQPLSPIDFNGLEQALDSIFKVIRFVHSKMFPDSDLRNDVLYQSWTGHFVARERIRTGVLYYLDSILDPDMESDKYSDEIAISFYKRFNINLRDLDYNSREKHIMLYAEFRNEVEKLREGGASGPPTSWP